MRLPVTLWVMLVAIVAPAFGQSALPVNLTKVDVWTAGECRRVSIHLTSEKVSGAWQDWAATVLAVTEAVKKLDRFDDIRVEVKRADEADRPTSESGLARLWDTTSLSRCGTMGQLLYAANRILSDRDLKVRRLYYAMANAGIDEEKIDVFLRKEFRLPKGWVLPDVGYQQRQPSDVRVMLGGEAANSIAYAVERVKTAKPR